MQGIWGLLTIDHNWILIQSTFRIRDDEGEFFQSSHTESKEMYMSKQSQDIFAEEAEARQAFFRRLFMIVGFILAAFLISFAYLSFQKLRTGDVHSFDRAAIEMSA